MQPTRDDIHPDAARDGAAGDESDETSDGVTTSLRPRPATSNDTHGALAVWDRRLTHGAKLRRAAVIALAVLLTLGVTFAGRLPALFAGISSILSVRQPITPIPTARTLTPHPPVPLAASPWQEIGLPIPHDILWSYAPVPSDPSTVYACVNSARYKDNPTTLWRSRDAGYHWQQMPVDLGNDTACLVQVADNGVGRISVLAEGSSAETGNNCQLNALYLSRDNGATWGTLDPGAPFPLVEAHSNCSLTLTPHHLYAYHYYLYQASYTATAPVQRQAYLARSDDGNIWTEADADIDAFTYFGVQIAPDRGDDTLTANVQYQNGNEYGTALWRSNDAGKHWRTLGITRGFSTLMVSQEPSTTRSALATRMLYGLTGNYIPEDLYRVRAIESSDGKQWAQLPPLPVPGAAPDRMGVHEALGVAADGKLLFLGVDPHTGVPTANGNTEAVIDAEHWLWAWDPRAQRWEVPQAPLRVTQAFRCSDHCWNPHLAWGASPDGASYGTYVWVMLWGADTSGAKLYRTFIPASR